MNNKTSSYVTLDNLTSNIYIIYIYMRNINVYLHTIFLKKGSKKKNCESKASEKFLYLRRCSYETTKLLNTSHIEN